MSTTSIKSEDSVCSRVWQSRKDHKVLLRLLRLLFLGVFVPAVLIAMPIYLKHRKYSEQLYPLMMSDQRLIDAKVSTTWCQSQIVKANTIFNAYLMSDEPAVENTELPVSMTRHLVLEDDMKEYWGFYLLRGSSVTVSTCVRWPGASLTIIRGHKHLHDCAFIGDNSSEELEELLEVAEEQGLINSSGTVQAEGLSNIPEKMKRAGQNVHFHHKDGAFYLNISKSSEYSYHPGSHELDAKAMRNILTQLFAKTLNTKNKQKENPHHHYEAVFKESDNIDKPPSSIAKHSGNSREQLPQETSRSRIDHEPQITENSAQLASSFADTSNNGSLQRDQGERETQKDSSSLPGLHNLALSNAQTQETSTTRIVNEEQALLQNRQTSSAEIFQDVLQKINSLGHRGKLILHRLMKEIEVQGVEGATLKQLVNKTINDKKLSSDGERKKKRDLFLSSLLHEELTKEDEDGDAALEEDMLHPDGIAEHRGSVNQTTMNDRSNSEFWSSFSSSEERLLNCKGLILNLPLTPHHHCTPKYENQHSEASSVNTVTYRVPLNGYYFFVFNSENEIQPNYLRVQFDLLKTVYNISNPVYSCKNSTKECSLPLKIFSNERTVLELPLSNNDSQWNEEYIVISTCEPRTMIYIIFVIMVPVLILCFAFY